MRVLPPLPAIRLDPLTHTWVLTLVSSLVSAVRSQSAPIARVHAREQPMMCGSVGTLGHAALRCVQRRSGHPLPRARARIGPETPLPAHLPRSDRFAQAAGLRLERANYLAQLHGLRTVATVARSGGTDTLDSLDRPRPGAFAPV